MKTAVNREVSIQSTGMAIFALPRLGGSDSGNSEKQIAICSADISVKAGPEPICIASVYIRDQFDSVQRSYKWFP